MQVRSRTCISTDRGMTSAPCSRCFETILKATFAATRMCLRSRQADRRGDAPPEPSVARLELDSAALAERRASADANRHVWPSMLSGPAREPFARQAALDWQAFLAQRGKELRPGGRAVIVVPTEPSDGSPSLTDLIRRMIAVLQDMVRTDKLRAAELTRMIIPIYHRSVDELRAPFRDPKLGLVLEELDNHRTPDPIWEAFQNWRPGPRAGRWLRRICQGRLHSDTRQCPGQGWRGAERRRTFGECLDAGIRQLWRPSRPGSARRPWRRC